jgi:hypothetical protein
VETPARAPAPRPPLGKAEKLLFGVLAPLPVAVLAFWALLTTTTGEGPSVGGRGMVLFLVLFPIGFVVGALLNCRVLFAPATRRLSAFLSGTIVPALMLVLAYAYLWRQGPFAH